MPSTTYTLVLILGLMACLVPRITKAEDNGGSGGVTYAKIKELAAEMAKSGLEQGEECNYTASQEAFYLMRLFAGKSVEDLEKNYDWQPYLPQFAKDLDPSKKDVVCAAKKGLYCTYDRADNYRKCTPCEEIVKLGVSNDEGCMPDLEVINNAEEYKS